jgi:hypothetical protein
MGEVSSKEHYFFLSNGEAVKSLRELVKALEYLPDDTFKKHVSPGKNDFANWVRYTIKDIELANHIDKVKTRFEIQYLIDGRMVELEGIILRSGEKEAKKEEKIEEKKKVEEEKEIAVSKGFDLIVFLLGILFGAILMLVLVKFMM